MSRLNILLLCDYRSDIAATVRDHIDSLVAQSRHKIRIVSILGDLPPALNLDYFDAVAIHYSLTSFDNNSVSANLRQALGRYRGLKAFFIQDEYRRVNEAIAAMREIGIDVLFTCVPEGEIEKVYPAEKLPGVVKINVLTGYVPEALLDRAVPSYSERPIDVGYRARKVPAWLGDLGQEKYRIGSRFRDDAAADGLKLDISFREEDRLYGDGWIDFVCRCKAMLGVESGASVFDFTGDVQRAVDAHTVREPGVDFETLQSLYFKDLEGKIVLNQISPRCFEAAALRTLMVLYEGDYSGRMIADRHYLALKKDHSNHAEIVAVLKDPQRAQDIIDNAYREIAGNPANTFGAFVQQFDEVLSGAFQPQMKAQLAPLPDSEFEKLTNPTLTTRARWFRRRATEGGYRLLFARILGRARPETREAVHAWLKYFLRPFRAASR
ncbi:MAG: hypothetical protein J0I29_11475 [Rhizobiales bacterium]|nr:hypothetical protein [Hyphomicrobiales bacterium]